MQDFSREQIQKLENYLWVKSKPWFQEKILWEKVWKYLPFFSKIPWISCICICNSLAMNACHENSDIDLFIITKQNRIWTSRIFCTLLLTILRQRKTASTHTGKFCLSFFITENAMDFSKIAIKDDIYLSYWIHTLRPILNRKHSFEKFISINTEGSSYPENTSYEKLAQLLPKNKTLGFFWDMFEKLLKKIFLPKTKKSFQKLWKPFWIVISDDILKFHNMDKRKEIRNAVL